MRKFLILVALLCTTPVWSSDLDKAAIQRIVLYYNSQGDMRTEADLEPFFSSASRVSHMVTGFPSRSRVENAHSYISWGANEVNLKRNMVCVNITGDSYESVGRVKFFSLDFGWCGMNSKNLRWTYTVADCLQNDKPFPLEIRQMLSKKTLAYMRKNIKIPKTLKLKKINTSWEASVRFEWEKSRKNGMTSDQFRKIAKIPFKEATEDDLDSILLYRIINEMDRMQRGWFYKSWSRGVYRRLADVRRQFNQ